MPDRLKDFSPQSKTQASEILRLLQDARGAWVPLPDILALGIAQYSARIFELRRELRPTGRDIQNKTGRVNGKRHSWFRLVESPAPQQPPAPPKKEIPWAERRPVTGLELWDAVP